MQYTAIRGQTIRLWLQLQDFELNAVPQVSPGYPVVFVLDSAGDTMLEEPMVSTSNPFLWYYDMLVATGMPKASYAVVFGINDADGIQKTYCPGDTLEVVDEVKIVEEFRTLVYLPSGKLDYVLINYGDPITPVATYKMLFSYDVAGKVTGVTMEQQS